ncbi:MAG: hypothetical protein WAO55_06835 [Candidatus Manganitrophaceae bacterium]
MKMDVEGHHAEEITMKGILLVINHAYLFFGTTLYVGVLWALHFFFYPTWVKLNLSNVHDHFIIPTQKATDFFTIVVPLMFLTNIVMVVKEWRGRFRSVSLLALICIIGATYVGQVHIIPINKAINIGLSDEGKLVEMFKDWMLLNDIRWVIMTVMWLTMMYYFVAKGDLLEKVSE